MNRRVFLKMAGAGGLLLALERRLQAAGEDLARKPNILFFFPDQHRFDWTSMNPALPDITPNLKKLAKAGVHFTNAICPSPLCAPSRACIAAGKEYERCGVINNGTAYPLKQTTFYSLLKTAGYKVLGCGKFDLDKPGKSWGPDGKHAKDGQPPLLESWGFTDGCDSEGKNDGWSAHRAGKDGPYFTYLKDTGLLAGYRKNFEALDHDYQGAPLLPDDAYGDNWIARNGIKLMNSVPKGSPWFLQVNFAGPHDPMDITKTMYEKWKDVRFPPASNPKGDDNIGAKRRNYGAMINNIDRWLGVYLDEIRKRGELENTLIVYSSDHGEMLGDHGYWTKSRPLQPSVCVPLVISGPGIRSDVTCAEPVETMDLTATFLDYAGIQKPDSMDSKSLRPFLGGAGKLERPIVRSALEGWVLAYDGQYKLISGNLAGKVGKVDQDKDTVLYDLKSDPGETTDVASKHFDVVTRLKPMLSHPGKKR